MTYTSNRKPGVSEKRERQSGRAADATKARPQFPLDLVQVRCVAELALDREPRALRARIGSHGAAPMRRQAIPDQDDAPTTHLPLQVAQEFDEGHVVVAARS